MKRLFALSLLISALSAVCPSVAQITSPSVSPNKTNVYILEFSQAEAPAASELGTFATTFVQLRLSQLDTVRVERRAMMPTCDSPIQQAEQLSKLAAAARSTNGESSFYAIRGFVEARPIVSESERSGAAGELVLNYELLKVVGCQSNLIYRRSETFTSKDILNTFAMTTDLLAARLSKELSQRLRVRIQPTQPVADDKDQKAVYQGLIQAITERLAFGGEFRAVDPNMKSADSADYNLEIQLSFTRPRNPLRNFAISGLEAVFFVIPVEAASQQNAHHYQISRGPLKGSVSDRDAFYADAAEIVAGGLERVRFAREANLTEALDIFEKQAQVTQRANDQLNLAKKYLCIGNEEGCTVRAGAALPLLAELVQVTPDSNNPEPYNLLGRAQYLSSQYVEAGKTFDTALSLASSLSPADAVEIHNHAGDAWYRAQDYEQAVRHYKKSLELSAQLPDSVTIQRDIRIQLARSLRFENKRSEALDMLLESAKAAPNPQIINLELQGLILDLSENELPAAIARLEAMSNGRLASSLLTAYIREATTDLQESKFDDADGYLKKADALLSEETTRNVRVQLLRLHASWYELAKNDFVKAREVTEQSLTLENSPQTEYDRSRYRYLEGRASDQRAGSTKKAYQDVVQWITPLAKQRFPGADTLLHVSNHALGTDLDTVTLMDTIIEKNPHDTSALLTQMYVCTEYLKDFECALKNAEIVEKNEVGADRSLALDVIEIYVLNRKYEDALRRITAVTRDPAAETIFRPINDFYLTWTLVALGRMEEAGKIAAQWKIETTDMQAHNGRLNWTFEGAETALERDPNVAEEKRTVLRQMMAAMKDPKKPLPDNFF